MVSSGIHSTGQVDGHITCWSQQPIPGRQGNHVAGTIERASHFKASFRHSRVLRAGIKMEQRPDFLCRPRFNCQRQACFALGTSIVADPDTARPVLACASGANALSRLSEVSLENSATSRPFASTSLQGMIGNSALYRNRMTIVFIGDIHQHWHYVDAGLAALPTSLKAAVLLGDVQCDRPLDELAAPLLDRGIAVHWIHGNHDNDGGPEMWANLAAPERNPLTASGALHGRVVTIEGLRIAGLGGTFRPPVWSPPSPPRLRHRHQLAADLAERGPVYGPQQRAALAHSLSTAAIWPEDVETLASQKADILVTHEAPSSHPSGSAIIDELARRMGARMIVHGHHHVTPHARGAGRPHLLGAASRLCTAIDGRVLWEGEKPRALPAFPAPWAPVQSIAA